MHGGHCSHETEPERDEGEQSGQHHRGHGKPAEIERLLGEQEEGDPAQAVDTSGQPLLLVERPGAAHQDEPDEVDQDHPTADDEQRSRLIGVSASTIHAPNTQRPVPRKKPMTQVAGVVGTGDELVTAFHDRVGEGQRRPLRPGRRAVSSPDRGQARLGHGHITLQERGAAARRVVPLRASPTPPRSCQRTSSHRR